GRHEFRQRHPGVATTAARRRCRSSDIEIMSGARCRARMTARRRVALIGVAAILFQAILFGWHHHGLALATHGGSIASVYNTLQETPATVAEDSCEICAVLRHQSASPPGCTAPPTPSATAS